MVRIPSINIRMEVTSTATQPCAVWHLRKRSEQVLVARASPDVWVGARPVTWPRELACVWGSGSYLARADSPRGRNEDEQPVPIQGIQRYVVWTCDLIWSNRTVGGQHVSRIDLVEPLAPPCGHAHGFSVTTTPRQSTRLCARARSL